MFLNHLRRWIHNSLDLVFSSHKLYTFTLILLVLPFYLNDLSNIYIKEWWLWLTIDYIFVKLFPLLFIYGLIKHKKMRLDEFGITSQPLMSFIIVFVIVTLIGTLIDQNGYKLMAHLPGYQALGGMPTIKSSLWNWVDLALGLLMVGICEEVIFRGYMHTFISRYTHSHTAITIISALAFGFIHWSNGLHAIIITSIIGAVFMIAYLKTHSLPAIMLAHFAVNFIDFGGVIPKSIFEII